MSTWCNVEQAMKDRKESRPVIKAIRKKTKPCPRCKKVLGPSGGLLLELDGQDYIYKCICCSRSFPLS